MGYIVKGLVAFIGVIGYTLFGKQLENELDGFTVKIERSPKLDQPVCLADGQITPALLVAIEEPAKKNEKDKHDSADEELAAVGGNSEFRRSRKHV